MRVSQDGNRKLREVAEDLVPTGELPAPDAGPGLAARGAVALPLHVPDLVVGTLVLAGERLRT